MNDTFFMSELPENITFEIDRLPDLPTRKFKVNGVKIEATDLRLLNETAKNALGTIIAYCVNDPNCEKVTLESHVDEGTERIVSDILMGMEIKASRGGKHNFYLNSRFLVRRVERKRTENGTCMMTFYLLRDNVQIIHKYAKESKSPLNYWELVVVMASALKQSLIDNNNEGDKQTT